MEDPIDTPSFWIYMLSFHSTKEDVRYNNRRFRNSLKWSQTTDQAAGGWVTWQQDCARSGRLCCIHVRTKMSGSQHGPRLAQAARRSSAGVAVSMTLPGCCCACLPYMHQDPRLCSGASPFEQHTQWWQKQEAYFLWNFSFPYIWCLFVKCLQRSCDSIFEPTLSHFALKHAIILYFSMWKKMLQPCHKAEKEFHALRTHALRTMQTILRGHLFCHSFPQHVLLRAVWVVISTCVPMCLELFY